LIVTASTQGAAVVLDVAGDVDIVTAPQVQAAVEHALAGRPPVLVLDLTGVTFLSSAGLSVLVAARSTAGADTRVRVVAASGVVRRPLELTGLDVVFALYGSRADALADG
jgi:anti-anti-sigma factor